MLQSPMNGNNRLIDFFSLLVAIFSLVSKLGLSPRRQCDVRATTTGRQSRAVLVDRAAWEQERLEQSKTLLRTAKGAGNYLVVESCCCMFLCFWCRCSAGSWCTPVATHPRTHTHRQDVGSQYQFMFVFIQSNSMPRHHSARTFSQYFGEFKGTATALVLVPEHIDVLHRHHLPSDQ